MNDNIIIDLIIIAATIIEDAKINYIKIYFDGIPADI
jgi:hypothetical protein